MFSLLVLDGEVILPHHHSHLKHLAHSALDFHTKINKFKFKKSLHHIGLPPNVQCNMIASSIYCNVTHCITCRKSSCRGSVARCRCVGSKTWSTSSARNQSSFKEHQRFVLIYCFFYVLYCPNLTKSKNKHVYLMQEELN